MLHFQKYSSYLFLPAAGYSEIQADLNLYAWELLGKEGVHVYIHFIQMIGFTVLEVVWSILSKENTFES